VLHSSTSLWRPPIRAKKSQGPFVLNREQQLSICKKLAEWHTPLSIQKDLEAQGIKFAVTTIYHYQRNPKWVPVIDRFRTQYVAGVMQVPIANKRIRLEKLEKLMGELDESKLNIVEKIKKTVLLLSEARQEMDQAKTHIQNLFVTQVNQMGDQELLEKRDQLIQKAMTLKITPEGGNGAKRIEEATEVLPS